MTYGWVNGKHHVGLGHISVLSPLMCTYVEIWFSLSGVYTMKYEKVDANDNYIDAWTNTTMMMKTARMMDIIQKIYQMGKSILVLRKIKY